MRHAPITYNIPIFTFYISLMQVNFKLTNEIVACKRLAVNFKLTNEIVACKVLLKRSVSCLLYVKIPREF